MGEFNIRKDQILQLFLERKRFEVISNREKNTDGDGWQITLQDEDDQVIEFVISNNFIRTKTDETSPSFTVFNQNNRFEVADKDNQIPEHGDTITIIVDQDTKQEPKSFKVISFENETVTLQNSETKNESDYIINGGILLNGYNEFRLEKSLSSSRSQSRSQSLPKSTVVIYIKCHGKFVAYKGVKHYSLKTIDHPEGKNISYLKVASFGKNNLTDMNFLRTVRGNVERITDQEVKKRLEDAFEEIVLNPTFFRNKTIMESRRTFKNLEKKLGESKMKKKYGKHKAVFVKETFSHVPFVVKEYSVDRHEKKLKEYGHGIFIMFRENNQSFHLYNITYEEDFEDLWTFFGMEIPEEILEKLQLNFNETHRRYMRFDTEVILDVIKLFPKKMNNIILVDESCSSIKSEDREKIPDVEVKRMKKIYLKEMQSETPKFFKGGRRREREEGAKKGNNIQTKKKKKPSIRREKI